MNPSSRLQEIIKKCDLAAQEIDEALSINDLEEARQHIRKAVEGIEDMRYDLDKLMETGPTYSITAHLDSSLLFFSRALAYMPRINESEGEAAWQHIRAMKDQVAQAMYHLHDALNLAGTPMAT